MRYNKDIIKNGRKRYYAAYAYRFYSLNINIYPILKFTKKYN